MNVVTKILTDIRFSIPPTILKIAFKGISQSRFNQAPVSIDNEILNRVIRARVIPDTNIVGGEAIFVEIGDLNPSYNDLMNLTYEIPPERLNHRQIMSVLSVANGNYTNITPGGISNNMSAVGSTAYGSSSDIERAAQRVMDSYSSIPDVSNAHVDVIGPNTIIIKYRSNVVAFPAAIRCFVANEENLSNINPRFIPIFSILGILAVKSYIYNNLIVELDQGFLSGGQELGAIKNEIEKYSDAEEMYRDYLTQNIQAVSIMNNHEEYARFNRLGITGGL